MDEQAQIPEGKVLFEITFAPRPVAAETHSSIVCAGWPDIIDDSYLQASLVDYLLTWKRKPPHYKDEEPHLIHASESKNKRLCTGCKVIATLNPILKLIRQPRHRASVFGLEHRGSSMLQIDLLRLLMLELGLCRDQFITQPPCHWVDIRYEVRELKASGVVKLVTTKSREGITFNHLIEHLRHELREHDKVNLAYRPAQMMPSITLIIENFMTADSMWVTLAKTGVLPDVGVLREDVIRESRPNDLVYTQDRLDAMMTRREEQVASRQGWDPLLSEDFESSA